MDIQLPQILFQMINFGVVTGALTFLLFKPVKKMLEERSARIDAAQKAAEKTLLEHSESEEVRKKLLIKAEKDAQRIIDEAKSDAQRLKKEITAEAKKSAEGEIEKERRLLAEEYKATIKELRQSFVTQVAIMTEKVIGEVVDQKVIEKKLEKDIQAALAKI